MAGPLFLWVISLLLVSTQAQVNLILMDGASGADVVDAVVSRVKQTCVYGDSDFYTYLRRLAYVESLDGTEAAAFNNGMNGGIWMISNAMFNTLVTNVFPTIDPTIAAQFNINVGQITYNQLRKPLYSGLAALLYTKYVIESNAGISRVPRSLSGQASFWATSYRPGSSATVYQTRATSYDQSKTDCNVGADIMFVLDESGSIGSVNYVNEKNFVVQVINNLVIGANANRVGVITYSSSTLLRIKLNQYADKTSLTNAVTSLSYRGGGTATYAALQQLRTEAFLDGNGVRPKGKGHPRVAIILTDGVSNSQAQTLQQAQLAKDADIILFSVGVGTSINQNELIGMASDPTCLHYAQLNQGFNEILDLVASISATACTVAVKFEANTTVVRHVDPNVNYNCEITVPPQGVTLQLLTTGGNLTFFLSDATYPNLAFYDVKVFVQQGKIASVYIPPGQQMTYCSIISQIKTNVTIITTPGGSPIITTPAPTGYDCAYNNPCGQGDGYYEHTDPAKYVQCGAYQCSVMSCPSGLVWQQNILACNWPNNGGSSWSTQSPGVVLVGKVCASWITVCSPQNTMVNGYYFPHSDPYWFIQCDAFGGCWEMPCAQGTLWDNTAKTCNHIP